MPRGYADTRLGQIHFREEGRGPLLLLIHQSGRSSRMFADLVPHLAARFRVVAVDMPGFGNSDPLPVGTSIEQLADCLADLIEGLGAAKAHVYGHHSGNKIATALAARHPARVDRLIIAGQSHSIIADQAERNAAIDKFVAPYRRAEVAAGAELARAENWAVAFRTLGQAWWAPGLIAGGCAPEDVELARNVALDASQSVESAGELYRANLAYDLGGDYRRIGAETLILEIVTEEEDRLFGRQGESLQQIIPKSRVAVIAAPDGDGLTLEDRAPDLATVLLDFLS